MRIFSNLLFFSISIFLLAGCDQTNKPKSRGQIIFGDSSAIVTEKDPKFLSNNVPDFVPKTPIIESPGSTENKNIDSIKAEAQKLLVKEKEVAIKQAKSATSSFEVPFQNLIISIDGIKAKGAQQINWNKVKSASFILEQGDLDGKNMIFSGSPVTKVLQRYQTVVVLETIDGKMNKLMTLPVSTSDWKTLSGSNGRYTISGLGNNQILYKNKLSGNALKNEVQKIARAKRLSKKEETDLLKSVRNIRTANQSPLKIVLQSVVWKITAKDASGKGFERELRIDINR